MFIRKRMFFLYFTVFLIFKPIIITQYKTLDQISMIFLNGIYLIFILKLFLKKKINIFILNLLYFFIYILFLNFINKNNDLEAIKLYIKIILNCIILYRIIIDNKEEGLLVIKKVLIFIVLTNLISMLIFPNGIFRLYRYANDYYEYYVSWWLLGNKNSMIMWLFPLSILSIKDFILKGTKHNIIIFILILITAVLSKSSTTIIVILFLFLYLFNKKIIKKFITMNKIYLFYLIFSFSLLYSSEIYIFKFVSSIFKKDVTFSGRSLAWISALNVIKENILLGQGTLSVETARKLLGAYAFVNTHNTLLQIIFEGGLLLLLLLLKIFNQINKKIELIKDKEIKYFLLWAVFCLSILISFESYIESLMFWMILTLIYGIANKKNKF